MKKLIAIILTISFMLCLVPVTFSVSAAATKLNAANKGWTVCRSHGSFFTDGQQEFYWISDPNKKTWDWPVYRKETLEEGTIEAIISPSANVGIFFGATGVKEYVTDVGSNVAFANPDYDIRHYWIYIAESSGTYKIVFNMDSNVSGGYVNKENFTLDATKYKLDGTSDISLKVSFNKEGKFQVFVNDVSAMTRSGYVPFGNQFGMAVKSATYTEANAKVGYVKDFSFADRDYLDWTARRGAAAVASYSGGEYLWHYQGTSVYNNPLRYNYDLAEGTITATVTKGSRTGIIFGATGLDNVKEGNVGNVSASAAPNFMYYWAYVSGNQLKLEVDSTQAEGAQSRTVWKTATLPFSSDDADYTIKVDFRTSGDMSISVNDVEYITVTPDELASKGYTIYGSEVGMMPVTRSGGESGAVAGSVKKFTIAAPHVCAPELVEAVAASCMKEGNIEYYACDCGKLYTDASGLVETTLADVTLAKNDSHTGNNTVMKDDDGHWSVCECGATVIEKAPHTYENGKDGVCIDGCGYTKAHICNDFTENAGEAATCVKEGTLAHKICNDCEKIYVGEEVVEAADLIIAKDENAHTGNNTTDYDGEYHWDVCECGVTVSEKVAHTYANGKDGACTAGCGYTKDHVCEAASHTDAKVPTCVEGGNVEYWTCECGAKYLDEACTEVAGEVELGVDPENHVIDIEAAPWISDVNNHWKACTCGVKFNEGAHDGINCTICEKKTVGVYKNGEDLYYIESTGRHATGKFYVTENASNGHVTEGW
ncbi:MAG: hypothetical protein E7626_07540, partial [Ruminococcaceae bacterium]|nr:hypothetical protein [Oscillospiraceae bacterium]